MPQTPKSFIQKFIEEYNKGNVITEVMVEYERFKERHYENYLLEGGYLFNKGNLTKRIEFMEEEIPYLKKLIKKGYTHL